MELNVLKPRKALNKAYLKVKPNRTEIESFKTNLIQLLDRTNDTESEEFHKNLVSDFLKKTYYDPNHFINTKGRNDLVIHNGEKAASSVGVIIEAKKPTNKVEMLQKHNINSKAFHELILYYLRERISLKNLEVKNLIATNINEWFIFDANVFEKCFAKNKKFVKQFTDFEEGRLSGTTTDFFYKEIAEPFVKNIADAIEFTYFDFRKYEKPLRNQDKDDDVKLISLYKLVSPEHLLKLPFSNDSNSLDKKFYGELLHIIGLTENKIGNKKLIERNEESERNTGSILENTIIQIDSLSKVNRLDSPHMFGESYEERLFNVGLELSITWVNRVLFLKLLEAQLVGYHKDEKKYKFLTSSKIQNFDDLNALFFQVLAKQRNERNMDVKELFSSVPYLNSSLFEPTSLEQQCIPISGLRDDKPLPLYQYTVLKDKTGKKLKGEKSTLEYLFEFLDAYDFSSEGSEEIQEDNKTLINASVLGLIFEKINGYKDGSFFTPGFITMYMCEESIREAVIQKFNQSKNWDCKSLDDLYDNIEDNVEANEIINSIKICDPAVGSGHFLVSALNEIIAIKHDLKILLDRNGRRLKEYEIEVVNDELIITDEEGQLFEYHPNNKECQRIQETLFHEKQNIIENCLFGVDINPNSVKICRLRLWIELLKSAYYGNNGELETLPNIDINIKCGNSLVSRFGMKSPLKQALKRNKITIDDYKKAVNTYRNANSKDQKWEMEKLIDGIKTDFKTEIGQNSKEQLELNKLNAELYQKYTAPKLFEEELSPKQARGLEKRRKELEKDIAKITAKIEDIKNNTIYQNAFEWRFEFPEVLDEEGDFIGFDLVIGNPPYGVSLSESEISYYRENYQSIVGHAEVYYMFIDLGLNNITKKHGILSFIIPNAWMSNKYAKGVRELILKKHTPSEIINFNQKIIFEDAQVETAILTSHSGKIKKSLYVGQDIDHKYEVDHTEWFKDENLIIHFSENKTVQKILEKIGDTEQVLDDVLDISNGCKPYQAGYGKNLEGEKLTKEDVKNRIYHANEKLDEGYLVELKGKHIQPYMTKDSTDYIKWGDWLMSPKDKKYFFNKKILVRQIIGKKFICTIDSSNSIADQSLYVAIQKTSNKIPLEYYLGLLNSSVFGFFFRKFYSEEDDLFPKIKVNELKRLPVISMPDDIIQTISAKVEAILKTLNGNQEADISAELHEIDQILYEAYSLTQEEIEIIESYIQ